MQDKRFYPYLFLHAGIVTLWVILDRTHKGIANAGAINLLSIAVLLCYLNLLYLHVMTSRRKATISECGWNLLSVSFIAALMYDGFSTLYMGAYGWFNVFAFMLIIGGIILDKMGVRFTGMGACLLMVLGCGLKYYAISTTFAEGSTLLGMKTQVGLAALGYAIFGVGVEIAGITVSKIIVKWFKGKEMALAMGMEMATARLGTMLALAVTVPIATFFGITDDEGVFHPNIPAPLLLCLTMLCIGTVAFFIYTFYDKKLDASLEEEGAEPEEPFRMKDIWLIVTNKGFWLIALLCVLFYSAVFPFLKYATDLMVQKYNVDPELAGTIPSLLPLGTLFLTPLFGNVYDRIGKGATLMIIGSVLLIFVHTMFALPVLNVWWFATIIMIILGIGFSLVPSAMWPSVPKIIPEKQLGTAYALIFWVQNWGLMGVPALIGFVLNEYCKGPVVDGMQTYDYTLPMWIFAGFGVAALFFALWLKGENKKKGYGLEEPNIKK